ncbi:hypothetical protein [Umezawaea sp.]|uniref:hypothetical protein n=1 Tax=Umezawaea sp. TaxID=1955258 RepID=UPI002ED64D18
MRTGRTWRAVATAGLVSGLVLLPGGQAQSATCSVTAWQVPTGATTSAVHGYDGVRVAVGSTSRMVRVAGTWRHTDTRAAVWDDGRLVLRLTSETAVMDDVNAAGEVVGSEVVGSRRVAVTFDRLGTATPLPGRSTWDGYWASLVTSGGDVVGQAVTGDQRVVVLWPAAAPGTYRELPVPGVTDARPVAVDDQLRIVASTSSTTGGGYVRNTDGTWVPLAHPANGHADPWAIRDGRVVGRTLLDPNGFTVSEWNGAGALVRTYPTEAVIPRAIGGRGVVGGDALVDGGQRTVLWRDGVVVDRLPSVAAAFQLAAISDVERTLVGREGSYPNHLPVHYRCS